MLNKIFLLLIILGSISITACSSGTSLPSGESSTTHMFGDFELGCGSESCM